MESISNIELMQDRKKSFKIKRNNRFLKKHKIFYLTKSGLKEYYLFPLRLITFKIKCVFNREGCMPETEIGVIEHYFGKIGVAAIKVTKGLLCVGDTIHIQGHTTNLTTTIDSMQIEHQFVDKVKKGGIVGIRIGDMARVGDTVFKVTE